MISPAPTADRQASYSNGDSNNSNNNNNNNNNNQSKAPAQPAHRVKRRAPRACLMCRNRKVRCDVMRGINPCTNCRLDGLSCVLANSSRGVRPTNPESDCNGGAFRTGLVSAGENENEMERDCEDGLSDRNTNRVLNGNLDGNPNETLNGNVSGNLTSHLNETLNGNVNGNPEGNPDVHIRDRTNNLPVSLTFEGPNTVPNTCPPSPSEQRQDTTRMTPDTDPNAMHHRPSSNSFSPQMTEHPLRMLPAFLRPLPTHLGPQDVQYLVDKDALTIPDEQLRNELLRSFIQYVYPSMPILDLDDFLAPIVYGDRDPRKPISLLLYQAVMFVSVPFVSLETLHRAGFHSRKDARKIFFQRPRLLYSLDYEIDHIPLLQALLLMTYWYESPKDKKDTWYWMGISLSLAHVLGFHRDPEPLKISSRAKRLQRRIWWSCFMRDRLLALGLRRPTRIRHDEFNVRMLTLDDFEMAPLSQDALRCLAVPASFAQDSTSWHTLSAVCIETAKLCVCIGNLLISQYTIVGSQAVVNDRRNLVVPRKSSEQARDIAKYDAELSEWHHHLGPESRHGVSAPPYDQQGGRHIIGLQQALLEMLHLTAVMALHRPRALQCTPGTGEDEAGVRESKSKVTGAAIAVTDIIYDLQRRAQLRYLSTSGIAAILWATATHIIGICSTEESVRASSVGRFYQCRQGLEILREIYASADQAVWFLEAVIRKAGVQIPMLGMVVRADPKPSQPAQASVRATGPEPLEPLLWTPTTSSVQDDFMNTNHAVTNDQLLMSVSEFLMGTPAYPYPVDDAQPNALANDWSGIDMTQFAPSFDSL